MCTVYDDDSKCFHWDSFQDWCPECLEDWFEIIGDEE